MNGLSSYTDLVDTIDNLPAILRHERRMRGLSLRAAAEEIGCSFSTLNRIEADDDGLGANGASLVAALRWLARNGRSTEGGAS